MNRMMDLHQTKLKPIALNAFGFCLPHRAPAIVFIFMSLFVPSHLYAATDCGPSEAIVQARAKKPQVQDAPVVWANYQEGIYQAEKETARQIFRSYMSGSLDPRFFVSCLDQKSRDGVDEVMPSVFIDLSLERLKHARGPSLQRFVTLVQSRLKSRNILLFRLVGHLPKESVPDDLPGSFHRGEGSILMNFARIPPNEWYVILLHELAHAFDDRLSEAIEIYADQDPINIMVKDKKTLDELSASEAQLLNRWIMAGLDRGLLAEYRAWLVTFALYREGVQEGLWKPIPWLDSILAQRRPGQDLAQFTYRFLNPHFTSPTQWPFIEEPVREALQRIREGLVLSPTAPPLGNLGAFVPSVTGAPRESRAD